MKQVTITTRRKVRVPQRGWKRVPQRRASEYRTDGTGSVVVVPRVILAVCGRISMRFFI